MRGSTRTWHAYLLGAAPFLPFAAVMTFSWSFGALQTMVADDAAAADTGARSTLWPVSDSLCAWIGLPARPASARGAFGMPSQCSGVIVSSGARRGRDRRVPADGSGQLFAPFLEGHAPACSTVGHEVIGTHQEQMSSRTTRAFGVGFTTAERNRLLTCRKVLSA